MDKPHILSQPDMFWEGWHGCFSGTQKCSTVLCPRLSMIWVWFQQVKSLLDVPRTKTSWAKAMYLSQSNNFVLRIMVWLIFWSSAVLYRRLSLVVWSLFFQQVMSALNESRTKVSWMKAPGSALSVTNFSWQKALQTKEMPPCLHKSYVCSCFAILLLAEVQSVFLVIQ